MLNIHINSIQPGFVHRICGSDTSSQGISHAKAQAFGDVISGWVNAVEDDMWELNHFFPRKGSYIKGSKTMSKLISIGILALLMSVLSSPVLADVDACEGLKVDNDAPKGLYGLCIAYWSAENGRGQDRVEQLYDRKAIAAGYPPGIPGLVVSPQEPDPVSCPCWEDEALLLNAACNHVLTVNETGGDIELAQFDFGFIQFQANNLFSDTGGCFYANFYDTQFNKFLPTTAEENLTCRAGVNVLASEGLLDMCP